MSALDDAAAALADCALVVIPTDTVYGLAARPDDPSATGRLFEAKGRPRQLELPILVANADQAERVARLDDRARVLGERFWPGALTLVLPRTPEARNWDLGGDPDTVGVRIPDHPLALALLETTGPLAVTSANPSGVPPLRDAGSLVAAFGDRVAIYLCEEVPLEGVASTVVDLAHGEPEVLREGAVTSAEIASELA